MAAAVPAPKNILRGHEAQVHVAAFVRHNERLATGDADGFIVLWDLAVMRPTAVWRAHDKAILGVEGWGRDRVITHGRDHKLIIWRLAAADEQGLSTVLPVEHVASPRQQPWMLYLLEVNTLNFCSFATCPSRDGESHRGLGAASDILVAVPNTLVAEAIDIYTLPGRLRTHTVKPGFENDMVMSLRLLHHEACLTLLAAFENGYASVHRLDAAGQWITTYRSQAHSQPVLSLDVHPSHEYFLTSSADSVVAKHPIPTARRHLAVPAGPGGQAAPDTDSMWRSSGPSLLSDALRADASRDRSRPTEHLEEWKHPLQTVNTRHSGQQSLRVRSDGKIFATAGWDSKVRVYSCRTLKELTVLQWHKVGAYAVAFANVGQAGGGAEDQLSDQVAQDSAVASSIEATSASLVGGGGVLDSAGTGVKDRRIRRVRETHWVIAGAKDGKVSLWDVY